MYGDDQTTPYDMAKLLMQQLMGLYIGPMYKALKEGKAELRDFTGFLVCPERGSVHIGRTHIGIEYYGPECITSLPINRIPMEFSVTDQSLDGEKNFFDMIVGFPFDGVVRRPILGVAENLIYPTGSGFDLMHELGWNFAAHSEIGLNTAGFEVPEGCFGRLVNAFFFDANHYGLVTRHIKWIDFIPVAYDDSAEETDTFNVDLAPYVELAERDVHYIFPLPHANDFKYVKLPIINRLVEIFGNNKSSETSITSFVEGVEAQFIITMKFGGTGVHPQLLCDWQSCDRPALKPDFFVVQPNGFGDIVEFKLPSLKSAPVIGRDNREAFSAELSSYIAQTRVYREYFEDPNNRRWFRDRYGFDVYKPQRIIVVGRRFHFSSDDWRAIIDDYKDVHIVTYDDLVDGVTAQFYR